MVKAASHRETRQKGRATEQQKSPGNRNNGRSPEDTRIVIIQIHSVSSDRRMALGLCALTADSPARALSGTGGSRDSTWHCTGGPLDWHAGGRRATRRRGHTPCQGGAARFDEASGVVLKRHPLTRWCGPSVVKLDQGWLAQCGNSGLALSSRVCWRQYGVLYCEDSV